MTKTSNFPSVNSITAPMQVDEARYRTLVTEAIQQAIKEGATQAAVGVSIDQGVSVNVRLAAIETLKHNKTRVLD